jgi:hypothetical protein
MSIPFSTFIYFHPLQLYYISLFRFHFFHHYFLYHYFFHHYFLYHYFFHHYFLLPTLNPIPFYPLLYPLPFFFSFVYHSWVRIFLLSLLCLLCIFYIFYFHYSAYYVYFTSFTFTTFLLLHYPFISLCPLYLFYPFISIPLDTPFTLSIYFPGHISILLSYIFSSISFFLPFSSDILNYPSPSPHILPSIPPNPIYFFLNLFFSLSCFSFTLHSITLLPIHFLPIPSAITTPIFSLSSPYFLYLPSYLSSLNYPYPL